MNPVRHDSLQFTTRRTFLSGAGQFSLGAIALQALQGTSTAMPGTDNPMAPRVTHHAAKAKRVIYLHMSGAPPHLDLFDYKPELVKHDGQNCPDSILKGRTFAFTTGVPKLMGT
ncbi:MAG TPA: sulfatase, partial [Verrucomicrobiales bacterium]|nr:sulfatase [Verrucomicrobiales bacterium]